MFDRDELLKKFATLAEADFVANGMYLNAPYRISYQGTYYKGRVDSIPIVEGAAVKVGRAYSITIERPAEQIVHAPLRECRDVP